MELNNKIMELYSQKHTSVKTKKIVNVLKMILVDGETNIEKICKLTPISMETLINYLSNKELMLNYLTEEEYNFFMSKVNLTTDNVKTRKIKKIIKLILEENETDIERICAQTPVSENTLRNYISDKEELLKYISEEQFELLTKRSKGILANKNQKLTKLIRLILAENETDLDKICRQVPITKKTIEKYLNDELELLNYMNPRQVSVFKKRIEKIILFDNQKLEKERSLRIKNVVFDIFNTRHTFRDVCAKNFCQNEIIEKLFYETDYLDTEFGSGMKAAVRARIKENGRIREKTPRDMFIVEDRLHVYYAKNDIYFLNQYNYKKLKYASEYLATGANMDHVLRKFEVDFQTVIAILSDLKLQDILKEDHYLDLKRYIKIERILSENDLVLKKNLTSEIVAFLKLNNFDMELTSIYFKLPKSLLNRVLLEIVKLPYFDEDTKKEIKNIFADEDEQKVR